MGVFSEMYARILDLEARVHHRRFCTGCESPLHQPMPPAPDPMAIAVEIMRQQIATKGKMESANHGNGGT